MDLQTLAIFVAQWIIIQLSKRLPRVGQWIDDNAPAVVALWTTIGTFLHALFPGVPAAHAGVLGEVVTDSLAYAPAVPVIVASGILGWFVNAGGLVLTDNVLRKIIWHYIFGKLLHLEAAKQGARKAVK